MTDTLYRGKPLVGRSWSVIEARIWSRVRKYSRCWVWTRQRTESGYGVLPIKGRGMKQKPYYVHRLLYENTIGPAPQDIDHLCDNPGCLRPAHLEAVTHAENIRRAFERLSGGSCVNGHTRTPENRAPWSEPGRWECLPCVRISNLAATHRYRAKRRAKLAALKEGAKE